jgi:hypothetical protein
LTLARRAWNASVLLHDEISRYVFCPGSQTSRSYVFADAKPMSPVHNNTRRYGSSSRFSTSSAFDVSRSSSSYDASGGENAISSTLSNWC